MAGKRNPQKLHARAAEYMQAAICHEIHGRKRAAIIANRKAFYLEKEAAMCLYSKLDKEPTRGILFRSAANLAIACGLFSKAVKMAKFGLAGNPDEQTKDELQKAEFEARMLAIESQPDYNQVVGELLYQDLQKGGTLVRGKKAFFKLFEDD
jgi:hypothetical protein